jgi:hypothetical protein
MDSTTVMRKREKTITQNQISRCILPPTRLDMAFEVHFNISIIIPALIDHRKIMLITKDRFIHTRKTGHEK